jgi:hypothetical protein
VSLAVDATAVAGPLVVGDVFVSAKELIDLVNLGMLCVCVVKITIVIQGVYLYFITVRIFLKPGRQRK